MWSIGCVFAELLSSKNNLLFGKKIDDVRAHLNEIIDFCGTPSGEEVKGVCGGKRYIQSLYHRKKANLCDIFPNANGWALDLLCRLLTFDPDKRITVNEALAHPYFDMYRGGEEEQQAKVIKFQCDEMLYNRAPGDGSDLDWMKRLMYDELVDFEQERTTSSMYDRQLFRHY